MTPRDPGAFGFQRFDPGVQAHLHPCCLQGFCKGIDNILGFIGTREHPTAPLGFQRHTLVLEKGHHVPGGKAHQGAIQEFPIARYGADHRFRFTIIAHIAPALAGDAQFFPQPVIALQ